MDHEINPVRRFQQHLRRAAALLEDRQFDRAAAEVQAALALDPESLPARALEERIATVRARGRAPASAPAPSPAPRFVPSGVDARSWIGFETRIQERRYRALMATIATAIAEGNGLAARAALEEARELRPAAAELAGLTARVAALPVTVAPDAASAALWSRAFGAVTLLLVGVAFLVGLEWLHPAHAPTPVSAPAIEAPLVPAATVAQPVDVIDRHAVPPADDAVDAPLAIAPEAEPLATAPRTVGTSGVKRVRAIEESGPAAAARSSFRPPAVHDAAVPVDGEIPDDYVAPASGPDTDVPAVAPTAAESLAAPARAPYANVVREPASVVSVPAADAIVTPPPAAGSASRALSNPVRDDQALVSDVLHRYARAYGALDAGAAHAVWPSVDAHALAHAFSGLASQQVTFDDCRINVTGETASASCRGRTSYVAKVGSREPRSEARTWTFALHREGDAWRIDNADARRAQ